MLFGGISRCHSAVVKRLLYFQQILWYFFGEQNLIYLWQAFFFFIVFFLDLGEFGRKSCPITQISWVDSRLKSFGTYWFSRLLAIRSITNSGIHIIFLNYWLHLHIHHLHLIIRLRIRLFDLFFQLLHLLLNIWNFLVYASLGGEPIFLVYVN